MIIPARKKYPHLSERERRRELLGVFLKRAFRAGTAQRFHPNQHLPRGLPTWKPARQPHYFKRYAVSDTRSLRIAHTACSYIMSDSDDSDDSGLPFDVEIEKCEITKLLSLSIKKILFGSVTIHCKLFSSKGYFDNISVYSYKLFSGTLDNLLMYCICN